MGCANFFCSRQKFIKRQSSEYQYFVKRRGYQILLPMRFV
ncbi:hypothetical protein CHUV0807_1911 [Cardiobacterium hominis]|uniref:Uncharacterized protein n=1 Tax=Cardiobacterium hominis TaxID=2718 RepID=A0A1C3H5T9_9GAMM|nr:hypothetical protein CHUV0807_1911 [Cardiobacterium hominis]